MKNFLPKFSKNCTITAIVCFLMLVILPLKLVILLSAAYWVARTAGAFKFKFPDVWEDENFKGDVTKNHRVFIAKPIRIQGTWYIFRYVNRVVTDGKPSYFFYYPKTDTHNDTAPHCTDES